jgi:hypothetical protein
MSITGKNIAGGNKCKDEHERTWVVQHDRREIWGNQPDSYGVPSLRSGTQFVGKEPGRRAGTRKHSIDAEAQTPPNRKTEIKIQIASLLIIQIHARNAGALGVRGAGFMVPHGTEGFCQVVSGRVCKPSKFMWLAQTGTWEPFHWEVLPEQA